MMMRMMMRMLIHSFTDGRLNSFRTSHVSNVTPNTTFSNFISSSNERASRQSESFLSKYRLNSLRATNTQKTRTSENTWKQQILLNDESFLQKPVRCRSCSGPFINARRARAANRLTARAQSSSPAEARAGNFSARDSCQAETFISRNNSESKRKASPSESASWSSGGKSRSDRHRSKRRERRKSRAREIYGNRHMIRYVREARGFSFRVYTSMNMNYKYSTYTSADQSRDVLLY